MFIKKKIFITLVIWLILVSVSYFCSKEYYFFETDANNMHLEINKIDVQLKSFSWLQINDRAIKGFVVNISPEDILTVKSTHNILNIFKIQKKLFDQRIFFLKKYKIEGGGDILLSNSGEEIFFKNTYLWLVMLPFLFLCVLSIGGWRRYFVSSAMWFGCLFGGWVIFLVYLCFRTEINIGPDEIMHVGSASWYTINWFPPSVDQSNYYINQYWKTNYIWGAYSDLSYFITAKVSEIFNSFFSMNSHVSLRVAQLFLVLIIVGLIALLEEVYFALTYTILFIIIPQFSFIHTYYNGEVIGFSLSFLALSLMFDYRNFCLKFFASLFMILNAKKSMILLLPALLYFAVMKLKNKRIIDNRIKFIVLSQFALALIFYRKLFNLVDQYINGKTYAGVLWSRFKDISLDGNAPENIAKRSTLLRYKSFESWNFDILFDKNWYRLSFDSFFAVFGQMDVHFNIVIILLSFCTFASMIYLSLKKSNFLERVVFLIVCVLTLMGSLYYSLSYGYQPQGRYLYAILIILGILYAKSEPKRAELYGLFLPVNIWCFTAFINSNYFIKNIGG